MHAPTPLRIIAGPIADESDLVNALRARIEEANVSRSEIDQECDLPDGYTSKRLAWPQIKYYGKEAFWNTAERLGLAVILVEDPNATKRYAARMKRRSRPQALIGEAHWRHARTRSIMLEIARKNGEIGAQRYMIKVSKRRRKEIARNAAVIRWERVKAAVRGKP